MSSLKKNIGLQMLYRILVIITPLITSPIISRALGAEKMGVFSATQAFANYFMLFAMLGIEYYGQRSIASTRNRDERSEIFCEIYLVQFVASIISIIIYYVSVYFWDSSRISVMLIQGLWVISCLFDINWLYFGVENFKLTVTRNFIVKIISVVCIVIFIHEPSDLNLYAIIMAGSTAISQIILWKPIGKYIDFKRVRLKHCREHVWPIIRLFIPMVALSIYHFMDKTMLDVLSTESEVGYYYAADKLIYIPLGLITAIGTAMLPRISKIVSDSQEKTVELLCKSTELSICLACAIAFGIAAISKEFVPFFFGKGYEKCSTLLVFFVPVLLVKTLSNVVDQQYLIPAKFDNQYTWAVTGGAIVNLICNLLLIPKLGSIGATIGTLIAETVVLVLSMIYARKSVSFLSIFLRYSYYVVCGFSMLLTVRIFALYLPVSNILIKLFLLILVGACTYFIFCLMFWFAYKDRSLFGKIILSFYKKGRERDE